MQGAIERVRGFYDLDAAAYARAEATIGLLKRSFSLAGYSLIDVPVLEHLELYLRKNGADILSKLYGLTDQGRRELAMRPEFTASVIRSMASSVQRSAGPVRVAYVGPVFRYEKPQRATARQFTQAGVELLGEASPTADADVLALACQAALAAGVPEVHVVIGHLGPLRALLSHLSVDGYAEGYLLEHLEYFNRGAAQQKLVRQQLGLDQLVEDVSDGAASGGEFAEALGDLTPEAARDVVSGLLLQMGVDLGGNSRSPDEIIARVLEKAQRHAAARSGARREGLERALQFCSALGALRGDPEMVLRESGQLLQAYDVPASALDELRVVVDLFRDHRLANVRVTLAPGMARGIAYYSGLIFEMYANASESLSLGENELQICGGGRYDGLPLAHHDVESVLPCAWLRFWLGEDAALYPRSGRSDREASDDCGCAADPVATSARSPRRRRSAAAGLSRCLVRGGSGKREAPGANAATRLRRDDRAPRCARWQPSAGNGSGIAGATRS